MFATSCRDIVKTGGGGGGRLRAPLEIILSVANDTSLENGGSGAVAKSACLESQTSRDRIALRLASFKDTKCFFPVNHKDSILWGTSVTEK